MDIQSTPSGTPSAISVGLGVDFAPTNAGDFLFQSASTVNDSTSAVNYLVVAGNTINATEASTTLIAQQMTVTGMSVYMRTLTGAGKSRTFTLRKNGADTAITCTLNNTNTCNASGSVSYADGDTIDISDTPTGTPAAGAPSISLAANANTVVGGGGSSSPARPMRLFAGFRLRITNGMMRIYRQ
jgi:hypothetical protein